MSQDPKQGQQRPATETYHVAGPGSLTRGKVQVKPGATLELTEAEATELGALVVKGPVANLTPNYSKRQDGKYKIVGPGTVWANGREHAIGESIELTTQDAQLLGATIEAI